MPEQTIRIIRAQDLTFRFTLAPPQDVTGWTVTFKVDRKLAGTADITKTVGSGVTLADAGNGIIEVALAKADTASLTVSSALAAGEGYVWELKRTNNGANLVLARGQLILEREVVS